MTVFDEINSARLQQLSGEIAAYNHDDTELSFAAASYAEHAAMWYDRSVNLAWYRTAAPPQTWPWKAAAWQPTDPRQDLIRAASLIISQIEEIDRSRNGQRVAAPVGRAVVPAE